MSAKYPGGFITKNYVAPTPSSAPGIWTLDQQEQAQQAGIWPFGGPFTYIEDVFSTYLYTGNGTSLTVTNNIDLSTKGCLVWLKSRSTAGTHHTLFDSARGANKFLFTDLTDAQTTDSGQTLNTTGFTIGNNSDINTSAATYASWTFRKQPKFFDVVTYTGDGTTSNTIAHSLGSTPGCIIIKPITNASFNDWRVWHRSLTSQSYQLKLNTTDAQANVGNFIAEDSTTFTVGYTGANQSGIQYIAYLFAHNAGGFGLTGTDNVISCGSYTQSTGQIVNLGFEPQWIMIKRTDGTSNWVIEDVMRGESYTQGQQLYPNTSGAEVAAGPDLTPTANGFIDGNALSGNVIYIAIRRGPMKVPTDATKVFGLNARTGTGANATVTGGQTDDAVLIKNRGSAVASLFSSRLTGTGYLVTSSTAAEVAAGVTILQASPWDVMDGVKVGTTSTITNASANTYINYLFSRAPSFFDEVCYTGTGVTSRVLNHNLTVTPEMIIYKTRSLAGEEWGVYTASTGIGNVTWLNRTNATSAQAERTLAVSSTTITIGNNTEVNGSGATYVAYLFATCAGVSKVGSYTGNGTTQTIDCGFTAGARFVLLKRTDTTGDWYVYDTARGMTTLTDPYLLINSTAAETATLGSVTTVSTGFALNSTILAAINVSAGTYIFLAIA